MSEPALRAPTFSVAIPLYNKEDTIGRAIRSVFAQHHLPEAIVVVDDGSSDASRHEAAQAFAAAPEGIRCLLLEQPNAGVSVARNKGGDATETDYIAFLDADDEWTPGHLGELVRLAEAVPAAGLLSTRRGQMGPDGLFVSEPTALPDGFFGQVPQPLLMYSRGYSLLHTSSVAVSRAAWRRAKGFAPGARKSQDIHLWLRLLLTETFAHSDQCSAIFHAEATGVVRRFGAVPSHFEYFLGTDEGRKHLSNPDLVEFFSINLASHVAGHRLRGDDQPVREMLRLAKALSKRARRRSEVLAALPLPALRAISAFRHFRRRRRVARVERV